MHPVESMIASEKGSSSRRLFCDRWSPDAPLFSAWCMVAAFGAYFCVYGIRKPFTATAYEGLEAFGMDLKTVLVTAQVLGYMISKFIGIKVIAEMHPSGRVRTILILTSIALFSLLGFASTPLPFSISFLFLNGLMLGMVFGLVLGFLEGRRQTEWLAAGLCASFILADGYTKSAGAWLMTMGVKETWMPFAAGLMFMIPLLLFLWMLTQIPPPSASDQKERQARIQMNHKERYRYLRMYAPGLSVILMAYLLITLVRSLRADFALEIWNGLGVTTTPGTFSRSEMWIALGIMIGSGCFALYRDNRKALLHAFGVCVLGLGLLPLSLVLIRAQTISPFTFMVLIGLGLYLPYVLVHTTLFERIMAVTPEKGNIGFLMYMADSTGYLGYAGLMIFRNQFQVQGDVLTFFQWICWMASLAGMIAFCIGLGYFWVKFKTIQTKVIA